MPGDLAFIAARASTLHFLAHRGKGCNYILNDPTCNFASLHLFHFFEEKLISKTILSASRKHNIKILQAYSISLSFPQFVKQDLKKKKYMASTYSHCLLKGLYGYFRLNSLHPASRRRTKRKRDCT